MPLRQFSAGLEHGLRTVKLEQFQQKCETVLRPELRENKEIERFRDSEKSGNALHHSHDDMCLNFGGNLAMTMFGGDRGCGIVGSSFEFSCFSGLDFVAKKRSLTIGDGRKTR